MPHLRSAAACFSLIAACVALAAAPACAARAEPADRLAPVRPQRRLQRRRPATEPSSAAKRPPTTPFDKARAGRRRRRRQRRPPPRLPRRRPRPDHADARRLLGYQRVGDAVGRRATPSTCSRAATSGSREFGWIKADDVAKYEEGLRPWGQQWITAAEDARAPRRRSSAAGPCAPITSW